MTDPPRSQDTVDYEQAAAVQVEEVRERLVADAAEAGAELGDAPVQNYVGILVERTVRELDIPRDPEALPQ
ncbi:MAG: hypothetical protein ABS81_05140 [Pseudonocardia sp. SCN 72-86]|nr:MAG: hypothetical protein ABS81_05140 [Pseudonocardia sp. SCN 72-86]